MTRVVNMTQKVCSNWLNLWYLYIWYFFTSTIAGNLNDWWEKATGEEYNERAKCIIDQYSEQLNRQTGLNLKGKQTQGENIADNGGIKEAYMAYSEGITVETAYRVKPDIG